MAEVASTEHYVSNMHVEEAGAWCAMASLGLVITIAGPVSSSSTMGKDEP